MACSPCSTFGTASIVVCWMPASVSTDGADDFAYQPLHAAAAGRHIEVCRVLLAAGGDVRATQHGAYTTLHEVAAGHRVRIG